VKNGAEVGIPNAYRLKMQTIVFWWWVQARPDLKPLGPLVSVAMT
jgi:hypothetical protein